MKNNIDQYNLIQLKSNIDYLLKIIGKKEKELDILKKEFLLNMIEVEKIEDKYEKKK